MSDDTHLFEAAAREDPDLMHGTAAREHLPNVETERMLARMQAELAEPVMPPPDDVWGHLSRAETALEGMSRELWDEANSYREAGHASRVQRRLARMGREARDLSDAIAEIAQRVKKLRDEMVLPPPFDVDDDGLDEPI